MNVQLFAMITRLLRMKFKVRTALPLLFSCILAKTFDEKVILKSFFQVVKWVSGEVVNAKFAVSNRVQYDYSDDFLHSTIKCKPDFVSSFNIKCF